MPVLLLYETVDSDDAQLLSEVYHEDTCDTEYVKRARSNWSLWNSSDDSSEMNVESPFGFSLPSLLPSFLRYIPSFGARASPDSSPRDSPPYTPRSIYANNNNHHYSNGSPRKSREALLPDTAPPHMATENEDRRDYEDISAHQKLRVPLRYAQYNTRPTMPKPSEGRTMTLDSTDRLGRGEEPRTVKKVTFQLDQNDVMIYNKPGHDSLSSSDSQRDERRNNPGEYYNRRSTGNLSPYATPSKPTDKSIPSADSQKEVRPILSTKPADATLAYEKHSTSREKPSGKGSSHGDRASVNPVLALLQLPFELLFWLLCLVSIAAFSLAQSLHPLAQQVLSRGKALLSAATLFTPNSSTATSSPNIFPISVESEKHLSASDSDRLTHLVSDGSSRFPHVTQEAKPRPTTTSFSVHDDGSLFFDRRFQERESIFGSDAMRKINEI